MKNKRMMIILSKFMLELLHKNVILLYMFLFEKTTYKFCELCLQNTAVLQR